MRKIWTADISWDLSLQAHYSLESGATITNTKDCTINIFACVLLRETVCGWAHLHAAWWAWKMHTEWPSEADASYITSTPRHCVVGTAGVVWCALQGRHCGQCVTNIFWHYSPSTHCSVCIAYPVQYSISLTHLNKPSCVLSYRLVNCNPVNIGQALLCFPNRRNFNKVSGEANTSVISWSNGN